MPYEKDYIMRTIQQFGQFLARLLSRIAQGMTEQAEQDLQGAAENHLGLRMDFILGLDNRALLDMFGSKGNLDLDKVYVVAQLLFAEARRREALGDATASDVDERALGLLLLDYPLLDEEYGGGATPSIQRILSALNGRPLPPEICERLIAYHEARGEFAKAENRLFDLVETPGEGTLTRGEAFYARLLALGDGDLERGDLSRAEAQEGLADLRRRFSG